MKRIIPIIIGICIATPAVATALTLSEVVNLFISLGIIPAEKQQAALSIVQQETYGAGSPVYQSGTAQSACPHFSRSLSRGSRGDDVSALQRYLITTGDYTYGTVTGYYGIATEAALQRYQARSGIVSYGAAAVTGYGVLGPQTREFIRTRCGASVVPSTFSASVTYGAAPLTVVFSNVSGSIDFGNGARVGIGSGMQSYAYTYAQPGTYIATSNGQSVTIVVTGAAQSTFSASPVSGSAPLTVIFSGAKDYITYGDGQGGPLDSSVVSVAHSYTAPGTYTATSNGKSVTISVTGTTTSTFSVYPSSGVAPLTVTFSGVTGTFMSNGDGTSVTIADGVFGGRTLAHTYQSPGTYTATNDGRSVTVVVSGASSGSTLSASPTSGILPLLVTFVTNGFANGTINFGDGSSQAISSGCVESACQITVKHTYTVAGTYTATLVAANGQVVATQTVTAAHSF